MIRQANHEDSFMVAQLAAQLWTSQTTEEFKEEFDVLLDRSDAAVFLCLAEDKPVGFAQCQLRYDYVEGTASSPVGYLEGIFVEEAFQGNGVAKKLLTACEAWAKSMGCREFASDCELGNDESLRFHLRTGFEDGALRGRGRFILGLHVGTAKGGRYREYRGETKILLFHFPSNVNLCL